MSHLVSTDFLSQLSETARGLSRLRTHFNLHPTLDDPIQRFLNAIEPESYVRPHRHLLPLPKWELFVVLQGSLVVLILDAEGRVKERSILNAGEGDRLIEIPDGAWHTLAALTPGTVVFELKPGPYQPLDDKDFAAWAPQEGTPEAAALIQRIQSAQPGDRLDTY